MSPTSSHSGSRVLVTGGAGYVGGHTSLELLRAGHAVLIVDTLERGSMATIDALRPHGELTFHQGDCGDQELIEELLPTVDAVMHFAAYARVDESLAHPERYQRNNVEVTRTLVGAVAQAGVAKFLFSSTCAVYGDPPMSAMPIPETAPLVPTNPYGLSKVQAESIVSAAVGPDGGFATGVLRYFNVIGSDPAGVLHEPVVEARLLSACLQAARGERAAFTINGTTYNTPDGTAIRDFVHVTDIAKAHLALLNALQPGDRRLYNVGTGTGASVREIIAAVHSAAGRPLNVIEGPPRPGDVAASWADSSAIRSELGWTPTFTDIASMVATSWTPGTGTNAQDTTRV
jgi:UDP-glucose 4-epimerase